MGIHQFFIFFFLSLKFFILLEGGGGTEIGLFLFRICRDYSLFRICRDYSYTTEKAMAPHSSTLAWKIPWTEEPGRLQSMGSLRVGHD